LIGNTYEITQKITQKIILRHEIYRYLKKKLKMHWWGISRCSVKTV